MPSVRSHRKNIASSNIVDLEIRRIFAEGLQKSPRRAAKYSAVFHNAEAICNLLDKMSVASISEGVI